MSIQVDIVKQFDGFCLDVHFSSAGGTLGILGASGSGKSMTLKCIAGLETPDKGRIVVNGRTLFDREKRINLRPQERKAGYLFQSYALFPNMTAAANIACAVPGRSAERAAEAGRLMEQYGLTELANRKPHELSGGQQQRTALARVMACQPDVLLLDEPFAALDAHLRENLQVQMKELLGEYRRDAVLVTHDRGEAYRLCNTLMILDEGRAVACDDTKQVFQHPPTVAAARLTGCRNISKAEWIDNNHVNAVEWDMHFAVNSVQGNRQPYLAVRAESIFPLSGRAGENCENSDVNSFECKVIDIIDGQKESKIILSSTGSADQDQTLFWSRAKSELGPLPEIGEVLRLGVAPEDILLLGR